jgi:hypothetical protein
MELNKEYKQSEYPIEELQPGTIIETIEYSITGKYKFDKDIVVITRRNKEDAAYIDGKLLVGVDVKDGNTYNIEHSISKYKILKLK